MKNPIRRKDVDRKGVEALLAYIANNPTISSVQLYAQAKQMGYDPRTLIDTALGSVKYDKSSASLSAPLEDILNSVYDNDDTPGRRYVLDPNKATSRQAKEIAKELEGDLGYASSLNFGKSRSLPDYAAVRDQADEMKKLQAIAHAGHELKHQEDFLIRPDFRVGNPKSFTKGHHFKEIYEPTELMREAKDLPKDEKVVKEVLKQSKKAGLRPSSFAKLRSVLGPLAGAAGVASALQSGDTFGATLEAGSALDPTGIFDVAAEVKRRMDMSPEEARSVNREDLYSAMPQDIANEQRMLDELEEEKPKKFNKLKEALK